MFENEMLNARILEVRRFISKQTSLNDGRIVKDYEIDFNISKSRIVIIDDVKYQLTEGSMLFKRPGQYVRSIGDYDMYVLTLNIDPLLNIHPSQYRRDRNTAQQRICNNFLLDNIPPCFNSYHRRDYLRIFERLCMCSYPMVENKEEQKTLINELLFLINADLYRQKSWSFAKQNKIIKECCQYINDNFEKDIRLNDLAKTAHLSPNYFLKLFKKETGMPPKEYLLKIRLEHAKLLLSNTLARVNVIAQECGFHDTSYFSLYFKKYTGETPVEYRNSQNKG